MPHRLWKLRLKIAKDGLPVIATQMQVVAEVMADVNEALGDEVTEERLEQTRRVTRVAQHLARIACQ